MTYNTLRALYFAVCAARKGTTSVVITNEELRRYFIGNRKGERLSEKRLTEFADTLQPVFPRSRVARSQYGPRLILYLNQKSEQTESSQKPAAARLQFSQIQSS